MNDYGYFLYKDVPNEDIEVTVTKTYSSQSGTSAIQRPSSFDPTEFTDYATFEKDEFDFKKPLYVSGDIVSTSQEISGANGTFASEMKITITPSERIRGSGLTLATLNDDYNITIRLRDADGTRSKTFNRQEGEFYPFPYNDLQWVEITFNKVEPYHFLKVIGFSFGTTRKIDDDILVDDPLITTHFSLTSATLEYDVLEFTIVGNKDEYNFVEGQEIKYSRTKQKFYVADSEFQNDGTCKVTCYDCISKLEDDFLGMMISAESGQSDTSIKSSERWVKRLLKGENDDITVNVDSLLFSEQKCSGTLPIASYRVSARKMLQGNALCVKRGANNVLTVFHPSNPTSVKTFTDDDIVSKDVELNQREKITKAIFTTHSYRGKKKYRDTSSGKVKDKDTIFYGIVDIATSDTAGEEGYEEEMRFTAPHFAYDIWKKIGTLDDDDVLSPWDDVAPGTTQPVMDVLETKAYYVTIHNRSQTMETQIDAWGFKHKRKFTHARIKASSAYNKRVARIKDCTVSVDRATDDDETAFKNYLKFVYGKSSTLRFSSMKEANAGDYVTVKWDNEIKSGYVSVKKDSLTGVYEYEVLV